MVMIWRRRCSHEVLVGLVDFALVVDVLAPGRDGAVGPQTDSVHVAGLDLDEVVVGRRDDELPLDVPAPGDDGAKDLGVDEIRAEYDGAQAHNAGEARQVEHDPSDHMSLEIEDPTNHMPRHRNSYTR